MAGYVIHRLDSKGRTEFVTPPGSEKSFSLDIRQARRYPTLEAARADRCPENEAVSPLEAFLNPLQ